MAAITEENFGRYLFLYRTEAVPKNISMQRFCMRRSALPLRLSKKARFGASKVPF
jgi:hypothetical protein